MNAGFQPATVLLLNDHPFSEKKMLNISLKFTKHDSEAKLFLLPRGWILPEDLFTFPWREEIFRLLGGGFRYITRVKLNKKGEGSIFFTSMFWKIRLKSIITQMIFYVDGLILLKPRHYFSRFFIWNKHRKQSSNILSHENPTNPSIQPTHWGSNCHFPGHKVWWRLGGGVWVMAMGAAPN